MNRGRYAWDCKSPGSASVRTVAEASDSDYYKVTLTDILQLDTGSAWRC